MPRGGLPFKNGTALHAKNLLPKAGLSSEKGSTLKGKNLLSLKWLGVQECKQKLSPLYKKGRKSTKCIQSPKYYRACISISVGHMQDFFSVSK